MDLAFLLKTTRVLKAIPEGWRYSQGAAELPMGYRWINNGKPMMSGQYENAILAPGCAADAHRKEATLFTFA